MPLLVILTALMQTTGAQAPDPDCGANAPAQTLAALIMAHESQQRTELQCNGLLAAVAAERAIDLADGSEEGDPTANEAVLAGGFKFPSFYPPIGNQVQAVVGEVASPEAALESLVRSYQHRDLVLGEGEFFSRQSRIGVGYHEDEEGKTQYVVLIAEPYSSPKVVIKQEFKAPTITTDVECDRTWRSSKNAELKKVCRERWENRKN